VSDDARARLVLLSGAANLVIRAEPGFGALCRVAAPMAKRLAVDERQNLVTLRKAHGGSWWKRSPAASPDAAVVLSADFAWEISASGGLANVRLEFATTRVLAIEVSGGASGCDLRLGRPRGECAVRVAGGVSEFALRRPADVGVRLAVSGGVTSLALDEFFFGAIGGKVRLESANHRDAADRYEVEISGGASGIRIVG
jgi:hypothetical protein